MSSRNFSLFGLIIAGVAVLGTPVVRAQQLPTPVLRLTRQQAIDEAVSHNPSIAAAKEQVAEAKAGIAIATALPDPSLVSEIDQERNFLNPSSGSERDIGLQFTVPFPYRTKLNGRIARGGWQAAQYTLTQMKQQLAAQTAQAYDAVQMALRHHEDLLQSKEISAQFLAKAQTRFMAGTVPKLDTIKAKVDLSAAENALIANERAIATSRANLNHLLGRDMATVLEDIDAMTIPPPLPDVNSLDQLAAAARPELRSMTVQRKAAHDSTTVAKQYWIPDVNLTLWRSQIDGSPDSYKFDGGITLPLFFWQHKQGQIDQAQHHEQELEATERDLFSQVMLDVRNSYNNATTAWRQAVFLRDELLPEAQSEFDVTLKSYGLGGSSSLDLLSAKSTLLDAESQYTDALGAVNDAMADLERAVGTPLAALNAGPPHEK